MLYFRTLFNKLETKQHTYNFRNPEMSSPDSVYSNNQLYYPARQLADMYDVSGTVCSTFSQSCGTGYVGVVDDACVCRCPTGLDPDQGCSGVQATETTSASWPAGNFALLKTTSGCPVGFTSDGFVERASKINAFPSDHYHTQTDTIVKKTKPSRWMMKHEFCVSDNTGTGSWGEGSYCILRQGGSCPSGFDEGFVQFSNIPGYTSSGGTLPDGVFTDTITTLNFCCRDDGPLAKPLDLPNTDPIILFRRSGTMDRCQEVKGMEPHMEHFSFKHYDSAASDYTPDSVDMKSGNTFQINFCYYTPRNQDCGGVIDLSTSSPATFTSPNYPSNYDKHTRCSWYIKSPENSRVKLTFQSFDVGPAKGNSECRDSVEIRYGLIGNPGPEFCGSHLERTFISEFNEMMVYLHSGTDGPSTGFSATVEITNDDDLSYTNRARDASYSGTRDYTRMMQPCLPWAEMTHCSYHPFTPFGGSDVANLESNYCRNPGKGLEPWCYTVRETCEVNYCDVSDIDECYDLYDDCSTLNQGDFCTADPDDDGLRCAKTCSRCPSDSSQTTCVAPSAIDGTTFSPSLSSYALGDQVTFTCTAGTGEQQIQTCSSDGTWQPEINFVCGACPTGYTSYNKYCLQFMDHWVTGDQATCSDVSGVLPDVSNNQELRDLLIVNVHKVGYGEKADSVWVAPVTEGKCNELKDDGTNVDRGCSNDNYVNPYFCLYVPSDRTVCMDQVSNCQDNLAVYPSMCKDFPDYAWDKCPRTCGRCSDGDPTSDVTGVSCGGTAVGDVAITTCPAGEVLASGNLERACMGSGQLAGSDPVCTAEGQVSTPLHSIEVRDRRYFATQKKVYILDNDYYRIRSDGFLHQWQYYSGHDGQLSLQVWRNVGTLQYKLVGQTHVVQVVGGRRDSVDLAAVGQSIAVQTNDVIGVHFYYGPDAPPAESGGVPYDFCNEAISIGSYKSKGTKTHGKWNVGTTYPFVDFKSTECLHWSFNAVVGPAV